MKIGVFDTGVGGVAVARELKKAFPSATIFTANDTSHVPYSGRPLKEILSLTKKAIAPLLSKNCDVIVIACNTITMLVLNELRSAFPSVRFVGTEPMIKPAAIATKTQRISVLATPATISSDRYKALKDTWAMRVTVSEPDCSSWALSIEQGDEATVPIEDVINQEIAAGSDVIVLACTHYHWLKERAEKAADTRAVIMEPSQALALQIMRLLEEPALQQ